MVKLHLIFLAASAELGQSGGFFANLVDKNPVLVCLLLCILASVLLSSVVSLLSFYFSDPFVATFEAIMTQIGLSFGVGGATGVVVLLLTQNWFDHKSVQLLIALVAAGVVANLVVSLCWLFGLRWLHGYLSTKVDLSRAQSGIFRWMPMKNALMERLR
jgi:hypothetical protein